MTNPTRTRETCAACHLFGEHTDGVCGRCGHGRPAETREARDARHARNAQLRAAVRRAREALAPAADEREVRPGSPELTRALSNRDAYEL